jgi:hypothetical protein
MRSWNCRRIGCESKQSLIPDRQKGGYTPGAFSRALLRGSPPAGRSALPPAPEIDPPDWPPSGTRLFKLPWKRNVPSFRAGKRGAIKPSASAPEKPTFFLGLSSSSFVSHEIALASNARSDDSVQRTERKDCCIRGGASQAYCHQRVGKPGESAGINNSAAFKNLAPQRDKAVKTTRSYAVEVN